MLMRRVTTTTLCMRVETISKPGYLLGSVILSRSLLWKSHRFSSAATFDREGKIRVLGIETSCDDSAVAVVSIPTTNSTSSLQRGKQTGMVSIESHKISSQFATHAPFGGVVPILAVRQHKSVLPQLLKRTILNQQDDDSLADNSLSLSQDGENPNASLQEMEVFLQRSDPKINKFFSELSAIAVTNGPGLANCLLVGVSFASLLSQRFNVPLIKINHLEGHCLVPRIESPINFPFVSLLVSGGHSQTLYCRGVGDYSLIGSTLDDSIGEVLDKIARSLFLHLIPHHVLQQLSIEKAKARNGSVRIKPSGAHTTRDTDISRFSRTSSISTHGGQLIEQFAAVGDSGRYTFSMPLARTGQKMTDFSFSGLKAQVARAVSNQIRELYGPHFDSIGSKIEEDPVAWAPYAADFAASFQHTAFQHLIRQLRRGLDRVQSDFDDSSAPLVVCGGVAKNQLLRDLICSMGAESKRQVFFPPMELCTDNGVMISWAAIEKICSGNEVEICEPLHIDIKPRWSLESQRL